MELFILVGPTRSHLLLRFQPLADVKHSILDLTFESYVRPFDYTAKRICQHQSRLMNAKSAILVKARSSKESVSEPAALAARSLLIELT